MTDVIDAEDLKIKIKTKAHENHLEPQDIMQMYFFERLLYRIGISEYKYNFILKGGLLLSAIFGDERRTTQDMDTAGGFVGWNNSSTSTVRNCYAHATVTRRENWGYSQAATRGFGRGALTSWQNNYYVEGDYTESNGGGTQLSWDQMRQQSSFSGYDFSSIWQMSSSWGVPVPIGANQTLSSKGVAVVSTDAGSTVQLYSGGSLLTTTTATSGGAEFQNLDFGSYSARIFRNGQSLTSGSYETVEFSLSSDNPWQMVSYRR